jgi:hypothetical protein
MFFCLINLSNSSFVLILHVPSLSFVGPKIAEIKVSEIKGDEKKSCLGGVSNEHARRGTAFCQG